MNLSGKAVKLLDETTSNPRENILILVDDVAIPFEKKIEE